MLKKSDMIWKSYMFNLKKCTLKFLLNSCFDTLPTQTNLLQCLQAGAELQGKRQETTNHILNGCKVALHQKKICWHPVPFPARGRYCSRTETRAGNFWIVNIEINAWSTLFLNFEIKYCLFSSSYWSPE